MFYVSGIKPSLTIGESAGLLESWDLPSEAVSGLSRKYQTTWMHTKIGKGHDAGFQKTCVVLDHQIDSLDSLWVQHFKININRNSDTQHPTDPTPLDPRKPSLHQTYLDPTIRSKN